MILKESLQYAWEMLLPHTHTQHAAYKYCARANVPMNIVCINTTHVHIQLNKHILKQQNLNPTCNMLPSLQKYAYANMLWYTHCDTSLRRAEPTTEFHTRFAVLARPIATVWKLAPHSSAPHLSMNKFNIPQAAGVRNERFLI